MRFYGCQAYESLKSVSGSLMKETGGNSSLLSLADILYPFRGVLPIKIAIPVIPSPQLCEVFGGSISPKVPGLVMNRFWQFWHKYIRLQTLKIISPPLSQISITNLKGFVNA